MDGQDRDEGSNRLGGESLHRQAGTDVEEVLQEVGFDADETLLTRRQAEVFVLREQGTKQATIAERLGTSRENVSGIEARARENIAKARETIAFVDALAAPIRVEVPPDTDLYDAPELVFEACDQAGIKLSHNAPELMKLISDGAGNAVEGRQIRTRLFVTVASDGEIRVRKQ